MNPAVVMVFAHHHHHHHHHHLVPVTHTQYVNPHSGGAIGVLLLVAFVLFAGTKLGIFHWD